MILHFEIIGSLMRGGADVAEIATGAIALIVGGRYLWLVRKRRLKLEKYLRSERRKDKMSGSESGGIRSLMFLMGYVAMTEAEVLDAAFASRSIKSFTSTDPKTGRADALLFQFENRANSEEKGTG